jgi:hypothetical protein
MTIGQMWESVSSKLNALLGRVGTVGLPFTPVDKLLGACDGLHASGQQRFGREQLYSGITGDPLDGPSFVGMVFYQRLRHMVVADRVPPRRRTHAGGAGQNARAQSGSRPPVVSGGRDARQRRVCLGPVNQLVRQPTDRDGTHPVPPSGNSGGGVIAGLRGARDRVVCGSERPPGRLKGGNGTERNETKGKKREASRGEGWSATASSHTALRL